MKTTFTRRLSLITLAITLLGVALLGRIASFQFDLDVATYFRRQSSERYTTVDDRQPIRGLIYDRNMQLLATNRTLYMIWIDPPYIVEKRTAAEKLAKALNDDPERIFALLNGKRSAPITKAPISTDLADQVSKLDIFGVRFEAIPERIYPQGTLGSQIIGFVGWDGRDRRGYIGIEGNYNNDLAGQKLITEESRIPFEANANTSPPPGRDIVLTIDRTIQFIVEEELADAINTYGAVSGSVLVMDPRTGEILAMASWPSFDPNNYTDLKPETLRNPVISDAWEPGSVFKIVTAALALRSGKITPDWTYLDKRVFQIGGANIYNWDRAGHGSQNFADILIYSWNVGTSTLSVEVLGKDAFYKGLKDFGLGQSTGIDLEGEAPGFLKEPGLDIYWSDSDLATNSFGQGLTVTPLQMLCYANTIANGGLMMQPHLRAATIENGKLTPVEPVPVRSPITLEVANQIRDIMVQTINIGEGKDARVPGYTVAGKTGTAQFVDENTGTYDDSLNKVSFIGFFPADEPRVSVLIKLDKVSGFASETASKAFAKLAKRLAVVMNIPTDEQRRVLRAAGGQTDQITFR